MRFFVKVNIPVEAGNEAAKAGTLGTTIQSILADLKPEAVYFIDDNGERTALLFLDMKDASQIPAIVEPWMLMVRVSLRRTVAAAECRQKTAYSRGHLLCNI